MVERATGVHDMDEPVSALTTRPGLPTPCRTAAALGAVFFVSAIANLSAQDSARGAPNAPRSATTCYDNVPRADRVRFSLAGDPAAVARTVAAERSVATQDLAAGRPYAAILRLEGLAATDAATLAVLARAYEAVNCREAFVETADRALNAGLSGPAAAELRTRLAYARAGVRDSLDAGGLAVSSTPPTAASVLVDSAWRSYDRRSFDSAAVRFARAVALTPDAAARLRLRTLQAQAQLESGAAQPAAALFGAVADSARSLLAGVDSRVAGPALGTFAGAAASRRNLGVLWASDAGAGRLVARSGDGDRVEPVLPVAIDAALNAVGAAAADPVVRALVWTAGGAGWGGL